MLKYTLVFEVEVPEDHCGASCDAFHYAYCSLAEAMEKADSMDDCFAVFKSTMINGEEH